ncbi:Dipeptide transport system permease protein DppC (TC 3.A.1.5.2) [[Actinomadura] parvosata subsp. kistnae]|uniref:ABC transporter permease n=2 Tax=Nonomuraea TaxID=83681 RepID=A0A1V0AAD8_9ACTN|nr:MULTISPECIES: ABC transporter permease [unclassified Nonomuraea]AQZ67157.1 ABC transporter permease [Nonomuraea sp. ATCC 55076]NJP91853.1 ABC transporter permease [Nonomuraea sp. FMUSA5-5]SPL94634.1 Dipeptide transport system permease protein DppC (TC 3.A.1.5.2) [Actinomadura parvosata subsp. kistnae]
MTSVAMARRRLALSRFWAEFRHHRAGVAGLVILLAAVLLALVAPLFIDESVTNVVEAPGEKWDGPSLSFPFGTDESGRSILLMIWWGSRTSLLIGFLAAVLSIVIGLVVGVAAGHFRGWTNGVLMRVTDWFLVLPSLVTALVLAAILGGSTFTVIMAIAVTSWPSTARLIRAQTLAVEARPYIERSKALGAGHWHITTRHVLPNVAPLLLASTTLEVASAIVTESTLAFLGVTSNKTSWGTMLRASYDFGAADQGAWWYILIPGLAILVVVMAFTLVGRALEAVLNPRLRRAA